MNKDDIDIVIYHGGCTDGFGSAFSAWKYLKDKEVKYVPAIHGDKPPIVKGKNVLICDFSYDEKTTLSMINDAKGLLILDHHKTAKATLEKIPSENKVFDMYHSGAYLTWTYFFPNQPIPKLILYIEDRDLWNKQLPLTDEFSAWFQNVDMKFEEFDKALDEEYMDLMTKTVGKAINDQNVRQIMKASKSACCKFMEIGGKLYNVMHLNTTTLKSEIGNQIMISNPSCDFALVYSYDDISGDTWFSLRSTNHNVDVSAIAKQFGGGGHRNASGVRLPGIHNSLPGKVHDEGKTLTILNNATHYRYDTYNVVDLNMTTNKSKIGNYLLQTKYTDQDGSDVQVYAALDYLRTQDPLSLKENFQIASVWNYDSSQDITWFSLLFHESVPKTYVQELADKTNGKISGNTLFVQVKGLTNRFLWSERK